MRNSYLRSLCFCSFLCASLGYSYLFFRRRMLRNMLQSFYRQKHNEAVISSRIINDEEECLAAVNDLKKRCIKDRVLGLDCEWRSDNKATAKVALLQLASNDGFCSLFRLCSIGCVPQCLSELLSDESIIKSGVAVTNDARKLYNDYGVVCKSCIDLRYMAKHVGLYAAGLGKMSEIYLDTQLDKGWRIRCSDWEAEVLSEKQINYAAKDAIMSVYLFEYFNYKYINETCPLWRRMLWTDEYFWYKTRGCWIKYFDLGFNEKSSLPNRDKYKNDKEGETSSDICNFEGIREKISTRPSKSRSRQFSNSNEVLKRSPIYHNAFIQAPDGMVLCTCSTRKAEWYLNKGTAELVTDNPFTVRLNFEPSGRAGGGDGYYGRPKKNICVVCGSSESLRRKNIVPHEYRKYFPVEIKEHSSHDILLFCNFCHSKSQFHDQQLKNMLVKQCDAPVTITNKIITYGSRQMIELPEIHKIRSASKALLRFRDKLPESKRKEFEVTIMNYLQNNYDVIKDFSNSSSNPVELNDDLLEKLHSYETWLELEKHLPHGMKVVDYYKNQGEDGIHLLEQLWRNHFMKNMAPKFLPDLWSVDYNHIKLE